MVYYKCNGAKKLTFEEPKQFNQGQKEISVILPTYNEEGNIGRLINAIKSELKNVDFEIIVMDDDSKDNTPKIIDSMASDKIIAVHRIGKRGIFSAILDGVKISSGKYIVIMDADFSHPPRKLHEFLKYRGDYDLVVGSRFLKKSGIEAPFFRKVSTIILNKACNFISGLGIKDSTGGFHLIRKSKFRKLRFKYPTIWGEFDLELLYLAVKKGWKIKEIPFTYKFREEGPSKSENLLKYAYVYLKRVIQLRFFR